MATNKEHFEKVLSVCETKGLVPKGKTADLMENYAFIVAEVEGEQAPDYEALDGQTKARAKKS